MKKKWGNLIRMAAIKQDNEVFTGKRHHDCFAAISYAVEKGFTPKKFEKRTQGFITMSGEFVDRKTAYHLAIKLGQLKPSEIKHGSPNLGLFSEDLY